MDPRPVRRAGKPGYPTKLEALEDPDLLRRHTPPSLRRGREIAGAATLLFAANLAACGGPVGEGGAPAEPVEPPMGAIVAPLFSHGDGRGATGCVVSAPPVFLSEEEALQIITEELSRHGLSFANRNITVDSVKPPTRTREWKFVEK
jgi:hypothetical protein